VIIASMGGAPTNPAWYHNLVANPEVTVEYGTETYTARAREVHNDERQRLYDQQAAIMPFFTEYQAKTERVIPVFVLERVSA
jgi:deazaflavin-dependent oxidoreductase (nitroreductase family)